MEDLSSSTPGPGAGRQISSAPSSFVKEASRLQTECALKSQASLKCLEMNQGNKSVCQEFFDAYKECRKQEHTRQIEERRKMT